MQTLAAKSKSKQLHTHTHSRTNGHSYDAFHTLFGGEFLDGPWHNYFALPFKLTVSFQTFPNCRILESSQSAKHQAEEETDFQPHKFCTCDQLYILLGSVFTQKKKIFLKMNKSLFFFNLTYISINQSPTPSQIKTTDNCLSLFIYLAKRQWKRMFGVSHGTHSTTRVSYRILWRSSGIWL